MSKHAKTLQRMRRRPPPADVTWEEFSGVLKSLGYEMLKRTGTGGSRRKFYNREKDALICCHEPHPRPEVDKGCIADVIDHLTACGLIGEENQE